MRHLLMLILMNVCSSLINVPKQDQSNIKSLEFIKKHLSDRTTIYFLRNSNETAKNYFVAGFALTIFTLNQLDSLKMLLTKSHYILLFSDFPGLNTSLHFLSKMRNWNSHAKVLVLSEDNVTINETNSIFELFWQFGLYNSVIISEERIFNWFPYNKESKCGKIIQTVEGKSNLPYLDKMPDKFPGCRLTMTWAPIATFVKNALNEKDPGAFVVLIKTIVGKLGMDLELLKNNTDYVNTFLKNGSLNVLKTDMRERKIDMAIIFTSVDWLDASINILFTYSFILLPTPPKIQFNNYILNIFEVDVMVFICSVFISFVMLWKFTSHFNWRNSIMYVFQINVQMVSEKIFNINWKLNGLTIIMLWYALLINAIHLSHLSSVSTKPLEPPEIDGFADLAKSDVKIKSFSVFDSLQISKQYFNMLEAKRIDPGGERTYDIVKGYLKTNSHAIIITDIHLHYFKNPQDLHRMKNGMVAVSYYNIGFRKGFPLKQKFDYWIGRIKEVGLLDNWIEKSAKNIEKFVVTVEKPIVKLRFVHVKGAFVILLIGEGLGIVCFAWEYIQKQIICKRNENEEA